MQTFAVVLLDTVVGTVVGIIESYVSNMIIYLAMFSGDRENNNPLGMVAALAAHILMPIAAMLIQLGISRSREYLADATGAKIIGNPRALASALARLLM